jgi:hypothetical protein
MMTMIVPDEEDEEFANSWRRNDCEYLKRGVRGSLAWGFSSLCTVCDGMQNQEERGKEDPPEKRDCPEFDAGKKGYEIPIEEIIQIIDLAYY